MVSSLLASCFAALLVSASILLTTTSAFQISSSTPLQQRRTTSSSSSALLASAPRFDKATEKWLVTDPETQGPSAGYNIIGSLYRAGPVPVVTRIFNGDQYEQAVLKFMAAEGCDRVVSFDMFYVQHSLCAVRRRVLTILTLTFYSISRLLNMQQIYRRHKATWMRTLRIHKIG